MYGMAPEMTPVSYPNSNPPRHEIDTISNWNWRVSIFLLHLHTKMLQESMCAVLSAMGTAQMLPSKTLFGGTRDSRGVQA